MYGERDVAPQQRLVDLLGEEALATEIGQRLVLNTVAAGGDYLQGRCAAIQTVIGGQAVAHVFGLPERERTASCANRKRCGQSAKNPLINRVLRQLLTGGVPQYWTVSRSPSISTVEHSRLDRS